MLNGSDKRWRPCLLPVLRGETFRLSPLNVIIAVGFHRFPFIKLSKFSLIHSLLCIFITKGVGFLSYASSVSIEINVYGFVFVLLFYFFRIDFYSITMIYWLTFICWANLPFLLIFPPSGYSFSIPWLDEYHLSHPDAQARSPRVILDLSPHSLHPISWFCPNTLLTFPTFNSSLTLRPGVIFFSPKDESHNLNLFVEKFMKEKFVFTSCLLLMYVKHYQLFGLCLVFKGSDYFLWTMGDFSVFWNDICAIVTKTMVLV